MRPGLGTGTTLSTSGAWPSSAGVGVRVALCTAVAVATAEAVVVELNAGDGEAEALGVAVLAGNGSLYGGQFRFFRKQFGESFVNLRMPFGKPFTQLFGDAFNFKITPHTITNLVAEAPQFASEFVVIGVLGKLSGTQKLVVLKRLPAVLNHVKRRVENNAVRVQVRIESARRVMRE